MTRSGYNIDNCPKCGGSHVAAEVTTWVDFVKGRPDSFDEDDLASAEPVPGSAAICRGCQHQWVIA